MQIYARKKTNCDSVCKYYLWRRLNIMTFGYNALKKLTRCESMNVIDIQPAPQAFFAY